jgi:hypothetical protein
MILPVMGAAAVVAGFHPLMFMLPATLSGENQQPPPRLPSLAKS